RINSPMHLPVVENDFRPPRSPWYCLMNLQFSRAFVYGIQVYAGLKNLLNFLPKHPILRPFDPFDKYIEIDNPYGYTFHTQYNYAPLQGIRGYVGIRWNLN
ncbi:MAG: TonB-dependent receptor, partial [Chitinophagales bacterium]|nr:TonB-dependent receptor [Chitinophagales bacterium]